MQKGLKELQVLKVGLIRLFGVRHLELGEDKDGEELSGSAS